MIEAFDVEQIRAAEATAIAEQGADVLMAKAAFGVAARTAAELRERRYRAAGSRVLILVGPGNNGGDALYAGANLINRGVQATAVTTGHRVHREALAAFTAVGGRVIDIHDAASRIDESGDIPDLGEVAELARGADAIIDGLLGIGANGPLRDLAAALVTTLQVEASLAPPQRYRVAGRPLVIAVDIPSGLSVNDGAVAGPVLRADVTVTFGAYKPAALQPPASREFGTIYLVDIGLSDELEKAEPAARMLESGDIADLWPVPVRTAHKYTRGVLGVVAGSETYPGAAVLTASAAVRAGVGMVRYLGPDGAIERVLSARPEVVPGGGRVDAWAVGPGVTPSAEDQLERLRHALKWAMSEKVPTVVDAGGFAELPDELAPWLVLTPHAGEMAQLLTDRGIGVERAQVEADPVGYAKLAGELTGATVLLKGPTTVVVGADGSVFVQADGTPWLATAGSGDVLTGLIGALLAGHGDSVAIDPALPARLAAAAALIHGRAAIKASGDTPIAGRDHATIGSPISAMDVINQLPETIGELLTVGGTPS